MSAKGRGTKRAKDDAYETPGWCTRALLGWLERNAFARMPETVIDAGCGTGAIAAEVVKRPWCKALLGIELDPRCEEFFKLRVVHQNCVRVGFVAGDYLDQRWHSPRVTMVVSNPPFFKSLAFVQKAIAHPNKPLVAMLLRLNWLRPTLEGGRGEYRPLSFYREHPPGVLVLERRPGFVPGMGTDATEYAWMVWNTEASGTWEVLPCEPRERGITSPRRRKR